jgi:hypothetical protein
MKLAAYLAASALASAAGTAWAQLEEEDHMPSGLVVLDQTGSGALSLTGNSEIEIPARSVYVNSSSSNAVSISGSAELDTAFLYIVGSAPNNTEFRCTGPIIRSVAPFGDPCIGTHFPSTSGMDNRGSVSLSGGAQTLQPGYYPGGITLSSHASITLEPGNYVIGGNGVNVTGQASITGEGVCLIIQSGSLNLGGGGEVRLVPAISGAQANVTIAQPRENTNQMEIRGNAELFITGTIYAPGATLRMVGTSQASSGEGPQMGDIVVAHRVDMRGTSLIKVGRPGSPPLQLPQLAVYD